MLRISILTSVATIGILAAALDNWDKQTTASPTRAAQAVPAVIPTAVIEETPMPAASTSATEGALGTTPATTAVQETLAPVAEITVVEGTAPATSVTTEIGEMPAPTATTVVAETPAPAAEVAVQETPRPVATADFQEIPAPAVAMTAVQETPAPAAATVHETLPPAVPMTAVQQTPPAAVMTAVPEEPAPVDAEVVKLTAAPKPATDEAATAAEPQKVDLPAAIDTTPAQKRTAKRAVGPGLYRSGRPGYGFMDMRPYLARPAEANRRYYSVPQSAYAAAPRGTVSYRVSRCVGQRCY